MTIRGFSGAGYLRFTCHLRNDATTDDAWIYKLARQGNCRRSRVVNSNVRMTISKYGARVEIHMLTRESKKDFGSLELEAIPGMFLYQYLVSQQDSNVNIMTCQSML